MESYNGGEVWSVVHGRLNITCNFGLHRCLPGIKIPYDCIEAARVDTWALIQEWALACSGHYIVHPLAIV